MVPAARQPSRYCVAVTSPSDTELISLVALLRLPGRTTSWAEVVAGLLETGSASTLLESELDSTIDADEIQADALDQAAADLAEWTASGIGITSILSSSYPHRLRDIHEAPPILFSRGTLRADDQAISVVGSRRASPRGISMADGIARTVVSRGLTVAAGLAEGIDTAAHRSCLSANGRTVAVIGTGILRRYPASNSRLHDEISERGLLVSQFWPAAPPQKHTFLMRNATMSGYSLATVVVEAGENSGARAQARMAVGHGRPVILTDLVVDSTEWGKALVGRPGVLVARSLAEFETCLTEVQAMGLATAEVVQRFAVA